MSDAPTTYTLTARSARGGEATAHPRQEEIPFDASFGMNEALPGPAELLLTAFAACALKNVERYSEMLPFEYEEARIEVAGERQDRPPKFTHIRYRIEIVSEEPDERVELLHKNIRKYGTITNTLAEACELEGELVKMASIQ